MTLEECVLRADEFIRLNGACLLLMDIIESRFHPNQRKLFADYQQLLTDLNVEFGEFLPYNTLTALDRPEKGFNRILGDGATAGINDVSVIEQVMRYAGEHPTAIPLRFAVAEDGYDEEGIQLIK